jgi:hypothetical protein
VGRVSSRTNGSLHKTGHRQLRHVSNIGVGNSTATAQCEHGGGTPPSYFFDFGNAEVRSVIKKGLVSNGDRCPLYPQKRTFVSSTQVQLTSPQP